MAIAIGVTARDRGNIRPWINKGKKILQKYWTKEWIRAEAYLKSCQTSIAAFHTQGPGN